MRKLLILALLISPAFAAYTKQAKIAFNTPPSSALTNYPVFIYISDATMKTTGNGGNVTNANCYDCVAFSDSACTTQLDFETVSYNGTTGVWTGYALLSSFPTSSPPNIYVCYGNSAITTDQSNKFALWATDANYVDVHHFGGATGSVSWANSATSGHDFNNGTGLTNATWTSGPGTGTGGISMTSSSTVQQAWGGEPTGSAARTLEVYYQVVTSNAGGDGENFIAGYGNVTSSSDNNFAFDYYKNAVSPCTTEMIAWTNSTGNPYWCYSLDANWHFATMSAPSSATIGNILMTFDGATKTNAGSGGTTALNTTIAWVRLNGSPATGFQPNQAVKYSEFRISSDQKSAAWEATVYNNLSSVTTFETITIQNPTGGAGDSGCIFIICTTT